MTELIALRGAAVEVLVDGSGGGPFTMLRYTAPPDFVGPPPHRHALTTEAFHVVEGALTVILDGEVAELQAGETALIEVGKVHSFANRRDSQTVFLVVAAPPGLEAFLRELARLIAGAPEWPPADRTALDALSRRYDQLPPENPTVS
jgi:quercetin dioxygenase-like cupin family protein